MRTKTINLRRGAFGQPSVPFLLSRRAHLFTTCKAGGGILPDGRTVRSSRSVRRTLLQRGQAMPASGHRLCSQLYILLCQQNDVAAYCPSSRRLPAKTCHWKLYRSYGCAMLFGTPIFSLGKRNRKKRKDGEKEWRFII